MLYTEVNVPVEFSLKAQKDYRDIFNEVEVDIVFTHSSGEKLRLPTFWKGENEFGIRASFPREGVYEWESISSDREDAGLHNRKGKIKVCPYRGKNPLYLYGRLKVSDNRRYLCYQNNKPFFWLGDTWWMGLCKRLQWSSEFKELTYDRVRKGVNVIQIVAGLYPDMDWFDERGKNEAGYPWTRDFSVINPDYFDMADLRIFHLINEGLVPCIVGSWGYYLKWMGIEKMKKHWRNLVARYSALPVVWCAAGEYDMPYYLSERGESDRDFQRDGWKEIIKYIREIDPYHNIITIHPGSYIRDVSGYPELLDFDMLQTGHSDASIKNVVFRVQQSYNAKPDMPVIIGEAVYEGIGGQCKEQIQRLTFWASILNGACGYTYGANGIWQINRKEEPYGPSPHGMSWGDTPWDEAMHLPGLKQLGIAKNLLEQYKWWEFQIHPEWIETNVCDEDKARNYYPYVAGIPKEIRIIYLPFFYNVFKIKEIERDVAYKAFLFNPATGERIDIKDVRPASDGRWEPTVVKDRIVRLPVFQDWVLVMEKK